MIFQQNVFGRKAVTESATVPSRLKYETEDFDFSQTMLEHFIVMEDAFMSISKDHLMVTHLSMKEDSVEILQEGFKDFTHSAVEFFKKMIKKFKEFMDKVFMVIRGYIGNFDKFVDKYKDKLKEMNPDFKISGYEYTFNTAIPRTDKLENIINSYNSELSEIMKMKKEDLVKERETFTSTGELENIRGYVSGTGRAIASEDYLAELKKSYRNGQESDDTIHVDKQYLAQTLDNYKDLKDTFKNCSRERDKIIRLIESMKDFFARSASVHHKGKEKVMYAHKLEINDDRNGVRRNDTVDIPHSGDRMDIVNIFYNFKWIQSKEIGSICVLAMTEKVNALKEAMKQHEKVIRKSLFSGTDSEDKGGEA